MTYAQRTHTYEEIAQRNGYLLLRRDDGKWTVVGCSERTWQVHSAMPNDHPTDGYGQWTANWNNDGIAYVSQGYSESYARRMFRKLTRF